MTIQKQLLAKPSHALLSDGLIEQEKRCNRTKRVLLKKLSHLLVNGGAANEYVDAYYEIPASKKNLRNVFFERIMRKAREGNWHVTKIADIASQIY